jgi:prepilin-type N-terminal cleavage/methylation domain-containing protein
MSAISSKHLSMGALKSRKAAFTLPEVMIVILIIAILLAIAVPNFAKARAKARLQVILGNMKMIEQARDLCVMERGVGGTSVASTCRNSQLINWSFMRGPWPNHQPIRGGYNSHGRRISGQPEVTFRGRTQDQWRRNTTLWRLL